MSNDPFFQSRYLASGSSGAEPIYNEFVHRVAAGYGSVISRTVTAPPGSPVLGDAYLVPSGASGAWVSNVGDIAFYINGWKFMAPRFGMRIFIQSENVTIDYTGSGTAIPTSLDGHVTLTPVFATGAWRINWDGRQGNIASVTLAENPTILMAPTNWRPGRLYTLHVIQDSAGGNALNYNTGAFYSPSGASPTITTTANGRSQILFAGPLPSSAPIQLAVITGLALAT